MAFGVTVDFNANVAKFSGQVDKISNDLSKFSKDAESAFSGAKISIKELAEAFGVVKIAQFVRSGIDTADMLGKLSDRTGIAVEELSGLKLAADLSDTSIEETGRAINKLSIFMGQNAEASRELGITAKEPIEAFLQFSDIFSGISDDQQRAAVGNKVLGRSYANLAPLMRQGSAALREQIQQGKEFLPVNKDMAKAAADFNDNLTKLSSSTSQYAITLAGPIIESFNGLIDKLRIATDEEVNFSNVMKGIGDFVFDHDLRGLTRGLDELNEKIAGQKQKIAQLKNEGGIGGLIDGLLGYDIGEERRKLELLLRERDTMLTKLAERRRVKLPAPTIEAPSARQLESFINNGTTSGGSSRASAAKSTRDEGASVIENLNRQIALYGETSQVAKFRYELEHGSLKNVTQEQRVSIENYARQLDLLETAKIRQGEYDDIVKTGIELAKKQQHELIETESRLNALFNADSIKLNSGINDVSQALALGIIDENRAKAEFDKLGKAYNESFIDPALAGTEELTVFAEQAARNIQDSFADFLFDPFDNGVKGMLTGFLNAIRRMVAEQASAQLLGKDGLNLSGIIGSGVKSAGNFITSFFETGGVMTPQGPLPLRAYATGGIASSPQLALFGEGRQNEAFVPLPDGRRIPVDMRGQPGNSYRITNNINIAQAPTDKKAARELAYQVGIETRRAVERNG